MARRLRLFCVALAFVAAAFVLPPSRPVPAPRHHLSGQEHHPEPAKDAGAVVMAILAHLAGLVVGLAAMPALSWAGTSLPAFQVQRPGFMQPGQQGIDSSLAASKPGEIDYVTRSRIEASYFPQVIEELKVEKAKLEAAPSKAERLQKSMQQLREYAKKADYSQVESQM